MTTPEADAHDALYISRTMQPSLKGLGPEMQGVILADLVSIYFAGHAPEERDKAIAIWLKTMRALIPASAMEIWGK